MAGDDILTTEQRRAVDALALAWGDTYDIGCTRGGVYYAVRDDGTGEPLEACYPDELDIAIRADRARGVMP